MSKPDVSSSTSEGTGSKSKASASSQSGSGTDPGKPIVVDEQGDPNQKKKKRKYSRGLKQAQKTHRGLAKANRRVARAVAKGFEEYYERASTSSRKKRDGAIRDAAKNWAKALSKTLREGSEFPNDLVKAFDRKAMRRMARVFVPPFYR